MQARIYYNTGRSEGSGATGAAEPVQIADRWRPPALLDSLALFLSIQRKTVVENQTDRRAKANFATVRLTLLSIVQALALELMWSRLGDQGYLYTGSFVAILGWRQIIATLLGILLIWLIYSSLVMWCSWVPTTTDAILPVLWALLSVPKSIAWAPTRSAAGPADLDESCLYGTLLSLGRSTRPRAQAKSHRLPLVSPTA